MMLEKDSHIQDEELAAITDEILAGKTARRPSEDNEFRSLVDTVVRLENAFSESEEEAIAKENIRKTWRKDWQRIESLKSTNDKKNPRSQLAFRWFTQRQFKFAIILAALLLFVIAAPYLVGAPPEITASAGAIISSKVPILIVAVLVVIALIIWGLKRK